MVNALASVNKESSNRHLSGSCGALLSPECHYFVIIIVLRTSTQFGRSIYYMVPEGANP